jgi:two-component system cell cycle sensor histidine kinase/response regulator CckA
MGQNKEKTRSTEPLLPDDFQKHKLFTLGTLSAGVIHDLHNIFTGMESFLDLLEVELDDPKLKGFAHAAHDGLEKSQELTTHLLSFLKQEDELGGVIDPLLCIEKMTSVMERLIPKQIHFSVIFCDERTLIPLCYSDMTQIFLNLVVNARDSIHGRGSIFIRTSYEEKESVRYFLLEVEDTGEGIPENNIQQIFDPFFTTKPEEEGIGLGLAIVKQIVDEAGGKIEIRSILEKQTTFRIFLPLVATS